MKKGFRKLKSLRSRVGTNNDDGDDTTLITGDDTSTTGAAAVVTESPAANDNNSNSNNEQDGATIIKRSNETLEEAYHRLKRMEFEKRKAKRLAAAAQKKREIAERKKTNGEDAAVTTTTTAATATATATTSSSPLGKKQRRGGGGGGRKRNNNNNDNSTKGTATPSAKRLDAPFDTIMTRTTQSQSSSASITSSLPLPVLPDISSSTNDDNMNRNNTDNNNNNNNNMISTTISNDESINTHQLQLKMQSSQLSSQGKGQDESKLRKILIRLLSGFLMVGVFVSFMYCGHIYICSLIFFTEIMVFRELLTVRYNIFFHIIEDTIPLFRSTQWMWFATAIFYTYSDFVVEVIKSNTSLHYLLDYARFSTGFSFLLYTTTFVASISTMHKDHIRFQMNQLCWTILVLCLTVGQLKYIMHNVYNGLIWFALPIMLVVSNDSFAWLGGITCGRKFINKDFNVLSPKKTWEGFIGGWIGTMIFGWHLAGFMAQYTWMTCPTNNFSLFPDTLVCDEDPIFTKAKFFFPRQIFELFPRAFVQMIPGIVDICMVNSDDTTLTPCISGDESHTHHHFLLVLKNFYPIQLHALGLSLFASFVAPFGGFLASAIKRAYGLKDFASFIPGHGEFFF